jgi:hypothetical protein
MEEVRQTKSDDLIIKCTEHMFTTPGKYIVSGEEQQGKTTVLKQAFRNLASSGKKVIYLDAASINSSDVQKILGKAISEQYEGISLVEFTSDKVNSILLDNIHEIGLNDRYRNSFLDALNLLSSHLIITCSTAFTYILPDITQLDDYKKFDLLGLGHQRRSEIIEKWVSLGVEECISENDLYNQCDEIKDQLNAVIRKNIVPSKPLYILMLLQMLEAGSQQSLDLSSYGHCYQQLIYQSFDNAKIQKKEVDAYLNVLTELAWVLHKSDGGVTHIQLESFFVEYAKVYLSVQGNLMIDKLKQSSILHERDNKIKFKYPYLLYFFVAKKIGESYSSSDDTQSVVKELIENLHREDFANILVFVTHHTKEKWVLEEIDNALRSIFPDHEPTLLSREQLTFMQDFISKIPELVIEQREIREERKKHNVVLDKIDREEDSATEISEATKKAVSTDIPAVINRTFKGMELSGQIIRNRHATLPKADLLSLAEQGASCGLRFLNFFLNISDAAKTDVVKMVANNLRSNPGLSNAEIEEQATSHFVMMTYGVINGVIRKTASAIGSKEAEEIYSQIPGSEDSAALTLLNQAITLQFTRKLDITRLTESHRLLKSNPVCLRILKDLAVQHVYMFPVNFKEKQKLSALLGITVQTQRIMDRKKSVKA